MSRRKRGDADRDPLPSPRLGEGCDRDGRRSMRRSKVSAQFAKAFGVRLTRKSLGKLVLLVSIALGFTLNWATLAGTYDAADRLSAPKSNLEVLDEGPLDLFAMADDAPEAQDWRISVLDELAQADKRDLRGSPTSQDS